MVKCCVFFAVRTELLNIHTKLHMPSASGSLIIVDELKEENFRTTAIFFYI
jgi:hypothetical protein